MKAAHRDLNLTMMTDTEGYSAHQAEEQAINEANQTYFANMLDQQTMTNAMTIATIMETMGQLSNQVQELTAKQTLSKQAAKINSPAETTKACHAKCALHNKN